MANQVDLDKALTNLGQAITDAVVRITAKIDSLKQQAPDFTSELSSIQADIGQLNTIAEASPPATNMAVSQPAGGEIQPTPATTPAPTTDSVGAPPAPSTGTGGTPSTP